MVRVQTFPGGFHDNKLLDICLETSFLVWYMSSYFPIIPFSVCISHTSRTMTHHETQPKPTVSWTSRQCDLWQTVSCAWVKNDQTPSKTSCPTPEQGLRWAPHTVFRSGKARKKTVNSDPQFAKTTCFAGACRYQIMEMNFKYREQFTAHTCRENYCYNNNYSFSCLLQINFGPDQLNERVTTSPCFSVQIDSTSWLSQSLTSGWDVPAFFWAQVSASVLRPPKLWLYSTRRSVGTSWSYVPALGKDAINRNTKKLNTFIIINI